ncbi:uncharacterized protein LOC115377117 [Myripristis murdjan]|uniref:uncharacterized protein LOC115377117 n=1 Tax=Myripristis murdjan TaxID=586833 RepID=UPI00117627C9|nr:uncharacterized protein LOC115377117 [Myripristis murdjan]
MEGETVHIDCCWNVDTKRVIVKWLKEKEHVRTDIVNKSQSQGCIQNKECYCSILTISNITRNDSGRYICEVTVDIPKLQQAEGNGTIITVTTRNNNKADEATEVTTGMPGQFTIIIAAAVLALLVLISAICFWRLKTRGSERAARVIYEVPHSDSEGVEVGVDGHSTSSSRGSSQWCQVPVYESFDYFERVETKGNGCGSAQ